MRSPVALSSMTPVRGWLPIRNTFTCGDMLQSGVRFMPERAGNREDRWAQLKPGRRPEPRTLAAVRRGIQAGLVASVPQVLGTHYEERLLGLPRGTANIGPRFIQRLGELTRQKLSEETRWLGASTFHFGYAAAWGAIYALAYERRPVRPALGGLLLASTIYLLTFPDWGVATRTRTERPHSRRDWRDELLLLTPPLIFGMGTALLYGRGPRRAEIELAAEILDDPLRREESRRLESEGAEALGVLDRQDVGPSSQPER